MNALQQLGLVFRVISDIQHLVRVGGRRLERAQLENRMKWIDPIPESAARRAPMARRAERRERMRELRAGTTGNRYERRDAFPWRPVVGYLGLRG